MNDERAANAIDRKIGQRVRTRRLEIGMSQERLAELLGVTFQQVQKYEKGVNRIAASRLYDIAASLDMPAARFFENLAGGRAGVAEDRQEFVEDVMATPEGAQLMSLFSSIKSLKIRRRVVELVKALADEAAETGKRG
ncbi:helix-turn-helix domain-containing protein [Vitreimonas flagellata]|uniref:helix-turn-helix domain-containing protein n=1 Tax=Vitreimonas flagellata TaxID=2560861 RepID=UPI001075023D|nr:helix-turn-helix transcriptional regulator [Vitreimonas flagellata]